MSTISRVVLGLILTLVLAVFALAALGYGWVPAFGIRHTGSYFNPPWWFAVSPRTLGVCWERREGHAGNVKMHYSPETRFVYVFDYST